MKSIALTSLSLILCFSLTSLVHAQSEAESQLSDAASFDPQSVLDRYLVGGTLSAMDGYTAEQKSYQKGAYVYIERVWENGDESLNILTYNSMIQKFQEWGFYPWGSFYAQGEWNENRKTMFYHRENGEPTAKIIFNEDGSADLEMLNLNNGDFFIWRAKISPKK